ncbi:MAG: ParA family protein [Phycisphaerae bacterium]|nr:ParA family protein [Phycisphaerae bacterium]
MAKNKLPVESLAVISGKGGSGKTVISLGMCAVLSEAGLKVLFVDCDTATHGATYFFEAELDAHKGQVSCLMDMFGKDAKLHPLQTTIGFDFLPSTNDPASSIFVESQFMNHEGSLNQPSMRSIAKTMLDEYDAVVFDCQAGYSSVARWASEVSQRHLIVLEADAISSSALRVLFLHIGKVLGAHNTWQVFNKLSEEEREIYEKVASGTFFANLPPLPFDWQVKAAFATCRVPSVLSTDSAFGLGVLRLMHTLFPGSRTQLRCLENRTVGNWYDDISGNIKRLETTRQGLSRISHRIESIRDFAMYLMPMILFLTTIGAVLLLKSAPMAAAISDWLDSRSTVAIGFVGVLTMMTTMVLMWMMRSRHRVTSEDKNLEKIDKDLTRFRTLIATDPRLREYARKRLNPSAKQLLDTLLVMHGGLNETVQGGSSDTMVQMEHMRNLRTAISEAEALVSRMDRMPDEIDSDLRERIESCSNDFRLYSHHFEGSRRKDGQRISNLIRGVNEHLIRIMGND